MAEVNQSNVKIDAVKFDSTNNFGRRCEVMDILTRSNLEDALCLKEKENDWDKTNRMVCVVIRSCLTQDNKYHGMFETFVRKL